MLRCRQWFVVVGSEPSVVYTIRLTPEPLLLSVALNVTAAGALNQPAQEPPLQAMADSGGAVSTCTS